MNITFLIGNGFDLNLGLNTQYKHFYPYFIKMATADNMIKEWITEDEMAWSDLEEKLGVELHRVKETQISKLIEDKLELEELLLDYLENEQNKFLFTKEDKENRIKEFKRSISNVFSELSEEEYQSIADTKVAYRNQDFFYKFISFNYTNIVDNFVKEVKESVPLLSTHQANNGTKKEERISEVLHVHGTLEENMVLGVNDLTQINNEYLKTNKQFQEIFIKSNINTSIGERMIPKAKKIISESGIICVFGMSLGDTDKMWWEEIMKWLSIDNNRKLVICSRKDEKMFRRKLPARKILLINEMRDVILDKGKGELAEDDLTKIRERIFVLFNPSMFNFVEDNK